MTLSDTKCRSVKAGERPRKLSDGEGLFLLVNPNGSKLWRLAYRFAGKQRGLALGSYPTVSLLEARRKRKQAKRILGDGIDPGEERRRQKLLAAVSASNTFRRVADEWLTKLKSEGRALVALKKKRWLLSLVEHDLGSRPIAELTPPELLAALRRIEVRGRHESAGRARRLDPCPSARAPGGRALSQHYDVSINYVGHAEAWDDTEVVPNIMARDGLVRFRKQGRVVAVASIFRDQESLCAELELEQST
jgi:hypothetical protein